jgi:myo-inositol 2-dehydrogenase / D-chiro-inositol 1-dehydrogenase
VTVRVAVIGAGVMGADHARIVASELPGAELRWICDADEARARSVAEATGVGRVSTDALATIAANDVDAVLIASPDATHVGLTLACLRARKPVLCEKPLAPNSAECMSVLQAESQLGRQLVQVGFMRRFDPAYGELKARSARPDVGAPILMHNFHRNVSAPANFTGQMAITNSAPHEFDIARFVLGTEYSAVSAFQPSASAPGRPIGPVFMVLRTVAGQLVNIEINNNAGYGYDVRCELVCEHGSIVMRAPVLTETHLNLGATTDYAGDWRARFEQAYRLQNLAWLRAIESDVAGGANAWDGYVASLTAERAVHALETGREAQIRYAEQPALYHTKD